MIDMTENDFGVLMRPVLPNGEDWEGDVQISVFSNLMPHVDDDVHSDYTTGLVEELGLADLEEENEPKTKITSRIGNVITLDFNTKCEGEG